MAVVVSTSVVIKMLVSTSEVNTELMTVTVDTLGPDTDARLVSAAEGRF